jgi:Domain of unknown function (DUF4345)
MALDLVLLVAALFALMGVVALARPENILAYFGIATLTCDGRNEVRAVYGGFGLAIAGLLCAARFSETIRSGAVLAVAVALLGMAAGRLISALLDGMPGRYPRLFLGVELAGAAMLLGALQWGPPA